MPDEEDITVRVVGKGDRWTKLGRHWMSHHELPRTSMYLPQLEGDGPELSTLVNNSITFKYYDDGGGDHITDDWRSSVPPLDSRDWTGTTIFFTSDSGMIGCDDGSTGSSSSGTRPVDVDFSSSKPCDGEEPPLSIYADDATFVRREDGIWCKFDIQGTLYLVNRNGERCARPNAFEESGGVYRDQRRPSELSPHVWWK